MFLDYLVVVVTRPLLKSEGIAEDHEAPEVDQFLGHGPEDKRRETTSDCEVTSSAPNLATISAGSFFGRYEFPGINCSLII